MSDIPSFVCPFCGALNTADSRFCYLCGRALTGAADGPAAAATPPATVSPAGAAGPSAPVAGPRYEYAPPPAPGPSPNTPVGRTIAAAPVHPRLRWLIGALAAGGALLLVVALAVAWSVLGPRLQAGSTTAPASSGPAPAAGSLDAQARAAVDASNQAQIAALRAVSTDPLRGAVIGQALQDNLALVSSLQSQGLYAVSELKRIDYQPAQQVDATHATIRTTESWVTTFYRSDNKQQAGQDTSNNLSELYHLTLLDGKWVVAQVDIHNPNATPAPGNTQ